MLQAALAVAHQSCLQTCTTIRTWKALQTVSSLTGFTCSEIVLWLLDAGVGREESPSQFSAQPGDLDKQTPCRQVVQEIEGERSGSSTWQEVCFIQFLGVDDDTATDLIRTMPKIGTLGRAGYH